MLTLYIYVNEVSIPPSIYGSQNAPLTDNAVSATRITPLCALHLVN